jgi:hypothetical protein
MARLLRGWHLHLCLITVAFSLLAIGCHPSAVPDSSFSTLVPATLLRGTIKVAAHVDPWSPSDVIYLSMTNTASSEIYSRLNMGARVFFRPASSSEWVELETEPFDPGPPWMLLAPSGSDLPSLASTTVIIKNPPPQSTYKVRVVVYAYRAISGANGEGEMAAWTEVQMGQ